MSTRQHHSSPIKSYDGDSVLVKQLRILIASKYSEIFHCVIVHGSVATNEVINYSDFDGLLIVKDRYANSKQLKVFKKESMKLILKFDPLQHHGWFQILESQLLDFPQSYLPHELLEHSKLLFPNVDGFIINPSIDIKKVDYSKSFELLILSIETQSKLNFENMRIYDIKSFLSKIMLLPSMYYSVKHKKGIFKKQSFDLVNVDFTSEEWKCIEIASEIRLNWKYNLSFFQKFVMTQPEIVFRRLTKKYIAPKGNKEILDKLNDDFLNSLKLFIKKIKHNILNH